MRKLPVYLVIDVSESMVGEPVARVEEGMRSIIQELRSDPYALESAWVSVIVFAGRARVISPLTELYNFYPPKLPVGGGTSLGAALDCLMDDIDRSVKKNTAEAKGDWKPIIFLFTDGQPTDNTRTAFSRWNARYRRNANLVCISIGNNTDTSVLGEISDQVLRLNNTGEQSFKEFFKWVTASIKSTSVSVSDQGNDDLRLAPTSGIDLEKVDTSKPCRVDENFVVLNCICSNTKKKYLIKYAWEGGGVGLSGGLRPGQVYKLVGAYPIDGEVYDALSDGSSHSRVNASSLRGVPACPCCGNQFGAVICSSCGSIICSDGEYSVCPSCGEEFNALGAVSGDTHVTRGKG